MNSAEVKCRHCGEVIEKCSDDCPSGGYTRVSDGSHYCNGIDGLKHTLVVRTVLSTEDRDELQYIMAVMRSFKMWSEVDMLERVLANAVSRNLT